MKIVLVAHDPSWLRKFESEASSIRTALGTEVIDIHHIGSTSIPGIAAKPIIDMLLEVTSVEKLGENTSVLEALGYEAKGEFGIPGRRYFRKDDAAGVRQFQVHAFAADSGQVNRHLAFRDYLRSHPAVAEEYSQLKRELAMQYPSDMEAYTDAKTPFIREVERLALAQRSSTA